MMHAANTTIVGPRELSRKLVAGINPETATLAQVSEGIRAICGYLATDVMEGVTATENGDVAHLSIIDQVRSYTYAYHGGKAVGGGLFAVLEDFSRVRPTFSKRPAIEKLSYEKDGLPVEDTYHHRQRTLECDIPTEKMPEFLKTMAVYINAEAQAQGAKLIYGK